MLPKSLLICNYKITHDLDSRHEKDLETCRDVAGSNSSNKYSYGMWLWIREPKQLPKLRKYINADEELLQRI